MVSGVQGFRIYISFNLNFFFNPPLPLPLLSLCKGKPKIPVLVRETSVLVGGWEEVRERLLKMLVME